MKILITDDHMLFREGLRYLLGKLNNNITVLEAGNCVEAVRISSGHKALDLILLDLVMEGTDGIEALKILRDTAPSVPIVIISGSEDHNTIAKALKYGAQGYIPKASSGDVMLGALRLVLSGGIYIPPLLLDLQTHGNEEDPATTLPVLSSRGLDYRTDADRKLTLRQLEVLSLMCKGHSNKGICRSLGLAEGTVKIHVTAILKTLGVANRTQAVIAAQKFGLAGTDNEN